MYLALKRCKNDCKIFKITLVQIFCPLKSEIAPSSIGFRLNIFNHIYNKTLDRDWFSARLFVA